MIAKCTSKVGALRRPWHVRRLTMLVGAAFALACSYGGLALQPAGASASPRVRATQRLAVLLYHHDAYRSPRASAPMISSVSSRRPITGEQTTLPVIGQAVRGAIHWLEVMLPGRPNGSTGWIQRGGTRTSVTSWHVVVHTSSRQVLVYLQGRQVRRFLAVVGKPSTPTPAGNFFVEETVSMPATLPGGPYALALSARSNVLQEFDGGPGQIGIHGRDGLGGTLGQAESHGCMRLATSAIGWLAARIGPGVPVDILR